MKSIQIATVCLITLTGCGSKPPAPPTEGTTTTPDATVVRNAELIHLATTEALAIGLSVYSKSHPGEAADIASKIREITSTTALAYLNGTSGASAAAVNGFLNSQFVTLPPDAVNSIALAAALLDSYLPAPSASTILSEAQLSYIKAFVQGLNDGSVQFLAGTVPVATTKTATRAGKWVNGK